MNRGNLTEGRDRLLAFPCEARVFDLSSLKVERDGDHRYPRTARSLSDRSEDSSVAIMLRADGVKPAKVPEVEYHCNATLPAQEGFQFEDSSRDLGNRRK